MLSGVVHLDVGGTHFTTSIATLTRDPQSLLARVAYEHWLARENQGTPGAPTPVFIDRDGTHFRYILNYLRDGPSAAFPDDRLVLMELLNEVTFYGLNDLKTLLRARIPGGTISASLPCGIQGSGGGGGGTSCDTESVGSTFAPMAVTGTGGGGLGGGNAQPQIQLAFGSSGALKLQVCGNNGGPSPQLQSVLGTVSSSTKHLQCLTGGGAIPNAGNDSAAGGGDKSSGGSTFTESDLSSSLALTPTSGVGTGNGTTKMELGDSPPALPTTKPRAVAPKIPNGGGLAAAGVIPSKMQNGSVPGGAGAGYMVTHPSVDELAASPQGQNPGTEPLGGTGAGAGAGAAGMNNKRRLKNGIPPSASGPAGLGSNLTNNHPSSTGGPPVAAPARLRTGDLVRWNPGAFNTVLFAPMINMLTGQGYVDWLRCAKCGNDFELRLPEQLKPIEGFGSLRKYMLDMIGKIDCQANDSCVYVTWRSAYCAKDGYLDSTRFSMHTPAGALQHAL